MMDVLYVLFVCVCVQFVSVFCRNCRTESFHKHVIENFDPVKFQGRWYAISTNSYWIKTFFTPKNVQFEFNVLHDGRYSIQSSGGFFGSYCDYVAGTGRIVNKENPAVFQASFDTHYSLAYQTNTYWILGTDYDSFAIIFTCWRHFEDGTCDPNESYVWTLSRTLSGHALTDLTAINEYAPLVCMSKNNFKKFKQDGGCDFNPFNFPSTYGIVFVFSSIFIGFLFAVVFFVYCLTKISKGPRKRRDLLIFE